MNVARLALLLGVCARLGLSPALAAPPPIDRAALVARHAIRLTELREAMPLGNGEFCFNVDGTGLQTLAGSTLSHWAWHSAPLPAGHSEAEIPATGTFESGRLRAPMRTASGNTDLDNWMFRNPHPANLGRLRWVRPDGPALKPEDVEVTGRRYDLWTGLHTARFKVGGKAVTVETCVHPALRSVDGPAHRSV